VGGWVGGWGGCLCASPLELTTCNIILIYPACMHVCIACTKSAGVVLHKKSFGCYNLAYVASGHIKFCSAFGMLFNANQIISKLVRAT
jgi:hypothetical protein